MPPEPCFPWQAFGLNAWLFLSLAIGDPWTFQRGKEPTPGEVIDLAWEHVWGHTTL